jgi:hypothetical protein
MKGTERLQININVTGLRIGSFHNQILKSKTIDMPTEVLLFLLGSVFTIGFIFYMYFSTRHKERMAVIDKGGDIRFPKSSSNSYSALKWGITLLCIGLALGIGIFLDVQNDNDGPMFTFPLLLVGGGLGQLLYYRMKPDNDDTV